jgi:uncharacterized protein YgfB (UPF0149 family)
MIGIGISIPLSKVVASSGGVAPSNTVAPVASVPYAIAGQTLTTTNGTWSGDPVITYSYQWQTSANGTSGWINVGTNANTILISTGSQQLLFYRCVVTATNSFGFASANSNVAGGVDSQANTHFNRVTTDSGTMTYGLIGVDTYTKSLKYIYNVSDITTKFNYVRHLDYIGYKVGTGSGVTASRAVQTIYSLTGVNFDLRQTTTTAQPALGAWNGTNFLALFSADSNGASTPNSVNNQLINDFAIEVRIEAGAQSIPLVSKNGNGSTNGNFVFQKNGNTLRLVLFQGSTNYTYNSTTTSTLAYVRVSRNSTTGIIKFFHSSDGTSWTQVGTDVTGITGTLDISATSSLWVGFATFYSFGNTNYYYANIYKDDSFTTITQRFQPSSYNRSVSATTFVSSTGETWSIVTSTTATGLKGMMIDQTMVQGNGTSMGMQAASASINTTQFTQYNVWRKYLNTITAGSNGVLNEYGSNIASQQGLAFIPNENASTESLYTTANGGLNGTSWQSNSVALKVSTFRGDVNGSPYEQTLATNNVNNTFNAVQASGANTTAIVATGDNLFARNNAASAWINANYVANLLSTSTDTGTEETNLYNFIADLTNII